MVRALATSLIFLAALGGLGGLFVARRVLTRIDAMNRSAHAIMAGDMSERLPVSAPATNSTGSRSVSTRCSAASTN